MSDPQSLFDNLIKYERDTALYKSIDGLLGWDERTGLPTRAGEYRAEQISFLAGIVHRRNTDATYGQWLSELSESDLASNVNSDQGAVIRCLKREYEKQSKIPAALVEEITRQSVLGQQAWVEARKANDFSILLPFLERLIALRIQQAEAVGYDESIYDALLDDYEPGEKTSRVAAVLGALRLDLVPIVEKIADSATRPDLSIVQRSFPIERQKQVGRMAAERIGFDFSRGRLDITDHPFCTELGPHDVRILTRYNQSFFNESFFGTMHEAGHGIYEQGLRTQWYGLPPGKYVSLGIHESQSRLWENLVGRSEAFWSSFYPVVQNAFQSSLSDVSCTQFYHAVNDVRPSLIRVEADEATYNLHIIIRFELEQAMVAGDLQARDLPDAWNARYESYLGLTPPNNSLGVLQDVHWSGGAIGYFSTYSLGNLYASQFFAAANEEIGPLDEQFAAGDFGPLRSWLQTRVYQRGQCLTPAELVQDTTGSSLSHRPFIEYLKQKLAPIYQVDF